MLADDEGCLLFFGRLETRVETESHILVVVGFLGQKQISHIDHDVELLSNGS